MNLKKKIKILITFLLFFILINNKKIFCTTSAVIDITKMDITSIQEAIDNGYLTYEKLVKLYLERIEKYNETYNAIISINENALTQAKKCDEIYKKDGRSSILFGIPIIVKDNIDFTDLPTTAGTKALLDSYPYENSQVVDNLLDSGAIILAKSNMSEFAFSAKISYSSYGSVKNAYDISYTTYGSSGGSAVSVAASFATASIGTDTNSSIRLPASAANIVGIRPTYGLISSDGIITYDITRDTVGPLTKNVSDNAILLTVLSNNGIDYTNYLKKDGLQDKKIGVMCDFLENSYSQINNLFNSATKKMENSGATIIKITNFYNSDLEYYNNASMLGAAMAYQFNKYIQNTSSKIKSFSDLLKSGGYVQGLDEYNVSTDVDLTKSSRITLVNDLKNKLKKAVLDVMDKNDVDVLIYPSSSNKLLKLNDIDSTSFCNNSCKLASATSLPAITIPLGFDSDGLPYGLEILARENKEDLLYEIAYAYEQLNYSLITPNSISPNLYTISKDIEKLKSLYEENIGINNDLDELAKDIFINYNTDNQYNQETKSLISKYEKLKFENVISAMSNYINIENSQDNKFYFNFKYIIFLVIILIIFLVILKSLSHRGKTKKSKKKSNFSKRKNKQKEFRNINTQNDLYMNQLFKQNYNNKNNKDIY